MKRVVRGAFALGLIIIVVLIVRASARSIADLLNQAGWRLLLLVPLHTAPPLLDVMGWRVLIFEPTRVRSLFLIAAIREAINRLLPVANVGGEFVGIRLLSRAGISGAPATSSVIVEMLLNLVAQYLFFGLGLAPRMLTLAKATWLVEHASPVGYRDMSTRCTKRGGLSGSSRSWLSAARRPGSS